MTGTKKRPFWAIIALALIVGGIALGWAVWDSQQPHLQTAPDFVLNGYDGSTYTLHDLRGKVVVLNFWASWCYSCREEARFFEEFWQKYKDKGIAVVGIAIQDQDGPAIEFARQFGKTYILGLDTDGKASIDYGVYGVPETFLIDRNGVIRHKEAGPVTVAMLEKWLPLIQ